MNLNKESWCYRRKGKSVFQTSKCQAAVLSSSVWVDASAETVFIHLSEGGENRWKKTLLKAHLHESEIYWSYKNTGEGFLSWTWVTRVSTSPKSPVRSNPRSCHDGSPAHRTGSHTTVRLWCGVSLFWVSFAPADFFPLLHRERLPSGGKTRQQQQWYTEPVPRYRENKKKVGVRMLDPWTYEAIRITMPTSF